MEPRISRRAVLYGAAGLSTAVGAVRAAGVALAGPPDPEPAPQPAPAAAPTEHAAKPLKSLMLGGTIRPAIGSAIG